MKIEDLMTRDVGTCHPTDTLSAAAQLMWERDCGCVPVISDDGSNQVVGILTDRDICMAAHFQGASPGALCVGDVMSTGIRGIGPAESPADAEAVMRDAQVRRLPVIDAEQNLLGLISLADLSRTAVAQNDWKKPELTSNEICGTLEAISTARPPAQISAQTAAA